MIQVKNNTIYNTIIFVVGSFIIAPLHVHAESTLPDHRYFSSHPLPYEKVEPDQPVYLASLGFGPSSSLRGKIVVSHVFWQDDESKKWTETKRKVMLKAWDKAAMWLKSTLLSKYDTEVTFVNDVIMVQTGHTAKHITRIETQKNSMRNTSQLARYFGHHTVQTFLDDIKKKHKTDSVALLIYINKKSKSFAHRCMTECKFVGEYAYINNEANASDIDDIVYTQIHELLHLFGADDLYKVAGAENYYRDDMLHHPPDGIDNVKISPITAYSIGALSNQPTTPFPVERHWNEKIKMKLNKK